MKRAVCCSKLDRKTNMELEKYFNDDYYKAIAFGCGSCEKCKKCNPDFCNFPKETMVE